MLLEKKKTTHAPPLASCCYVTSSNKMSF